MSNFESSRHRNFQKFFFNRASQFWCPQVPSICLNILLSFLKQNFLNSQFPCVFYCEVLSRYITLYWCCSTLLRSQTPSVTLRFHHKEDYNRFVVHMKWVMKCFLLGIILTENLSWKSAVSRKEHLHLNEQIIFLSPHFLKTQSSLKLSIYFLVYESLLRLKESKENLKHILKVSQELDLFKSSFIQPWIQKA